MVRKRQDSLFSDLVVSNEQVNLVKSIAKMEWVDEISS